MSDHHKRLIDWFNKNSGKYHVWDLFRDVMALLSLSLQQPTNKLTGNQALWEKKESEYMSIVGRYDKEIIAKTPEVLHIIMDFFEHNTSDFLGECFMETELGSKYNGQFFSPYHLSKMCATVTSSYEDIIKENGFVLANDPAVGAGSMPIAIADVMREQKFNPQEQLFFIGGDVDRRVLDMCFIQMTLLGVPTKLYHQNALSLEMLGDPLINMFWYLQRCDSKIACRESLPAKIEKEPINAHKRSKRSRKNRVIKNT